jgi:UDP-glucose 4-epimerase
MGSRGSVIPVWKSLLDRKKSIVITDPNMSRYMMSINSAVNLILLSCENGNDIFGGTFIFKMPVVKLMDLAKIILKHHPNGEECGYVVNGLLPGETISEQLMSNTECYHAEDHSHYFFVPSTIRIFENRKIGAQENVNIENNKTDSRLQTPLEYDELEKLLLSEGLI